MSENQKKILANQIKADLQKDLEQLKIERQKVEEKYQLKLVELLKRNLSEEITEKNEKARLELSQILEKKENDLKNYLEDKNKEEFKELKRESAEKSKELEAKIKQLYYWLLGTVFVLLVVATLNIYSFIK